MKKSLVIVESPTKMKSLKKFLGKNFTFASSYGHIIDLPAKKFGIDPETFEPEYTVLDKKKTSCRRLEKGGKRVRYDLPRSATPTAKERRSHGISPRSCRKMLSSSERSFMR